MSQKLDINNWLGGISFSDRLGKEGSYFVGRSINPHNTANFGYLCPGAEPTNITSTISQVASGVLDNYNNKLYLLEASTGIRQYNLIGSRFTWGTVYPHTISNTGSNLPVGEDITIYPIGDTNYLLYAWLGYNTTQTTVGKVKLSPTSSNDFDEDFMAKEPAGASYFSGAQTSPNFPHPMLKWGSSGFLYIGDGRNLHQFDGQTGANGTLTKNKFQLPRFWVITSLFDAGEFIGITARYNPSSTWIQALYGNETAVFFWDGTSSQFTKRVNVEDIEIVASKNLNGEFYIFGINLLSEGTIRKWDGARFVLEKIISKNVNYASYSSTRASLRRFRDVDIFQNMLIFTAGIPRSTPGIGDGDIYLYGSSKEEIPKSLFHFGRAIAGTNVVPYAIFITYDYIYVSSYNPDVGIYYFSKLSPTGVNATDFLYKSLYYEFPQTARINSVTLYFKELSGSQGDDVLIDYDYGIGNKHLGNISHAEDGDITSKELSGKNILCDNLRIVIQPDEGAGIKYGKISIDYDLI